MSEITGSGGYGGTGGADAPVPMTGQGSGGVSTPDTGYSGGDSAPQGRPAVNLEEFEEFKQFKSQVNRTIAERDKAAREAEKKWQAQLAEKERRAKIAEEELEKRVVSNLDEYGQMEYRAQQEARKRQELEERLNEIETVKSREEFFGVLKEKYGVEPTDDSHPVMALQSVTDQLFSRNQVLEQELAKYKREAEARKAALDDTPDLGGGTPVHPVTDIQRQYNQAMLEMRGSDADRLSRQAAENGLQLDRLAWLKLKQQRGQAQPVQGNAR